MHTFVFECTLHLLEAVWGFFSLAAKHDLFVCYPPEAPHLSLSLFLPFLYVLVVVVWGPHITHSTLSLCPSGRRARLWVAVCPIDHQCLLSRCVQGKHSCEALMQNDHWVWCHLERGYTRAKATQTATRDRETDWSCVSDYFLSFSL